MKRAKSDMREELLTEGEEEEVMMKSRREREEEEGLLTPRESEDKVLPLLVCLLQQYSRQVVCVYMCRVVSFLEGI